jgi:hypothetical protein
MPIGNGIETPPLINGIEYTHADIVLLIGLTPYIGVTAIDYSDPQEITPNFSTGNKPTSVGIGKMEPQGSITMTLGAVEALIAGAPNRRLQNIPFFDVRVNYFSSAGGIFVSHRLVNCLFKGRNPNSAVDNSQIEETLELFVSDIQY